MLLILEITICILFLSFSNSVLATELTIQAYDNASLAKKSEYRGYIIGVTSALGWANAANENRGLSPLFCAPEDQKISPGLALRVLETEIKQVRSSADQTIYQTRTVTQALIIGLEKRFPCTKSAERVTNNYPFQIAPLTEIVAQLYK